MIGRTAIKLDLRGKVIDTEVAFTDTLLRASSEQTVPSGLVSVIPQPWIIRTPCLVWNASINARGTADPPQMIIRRSFTATWRALPSSCLASCTASSAKRGAWAMQGGSPLAILVEGDRELAEDVWERHGAAVARALIRMPALRAQEQERSRIAQDSLADASAYAAETIGAALESPAVMQPAEDFSGRDARISRPLVPTSVWRKVPQLSFRVGGDTGTQGRMRTTLVVVGHPLPQSFPQMLLAEWNHIVQTLTPHRSDQPFAERIRLRCLHRRAQHLQTEGLQLIVHFCRKDRVAVVNEKPIVVIAGKCLAKLL